MKTMLSLLGVFLIIGAVLQNGQNDQAGAVEPYPNQKYQNATQSETLLRMNQPQLGWVLHDDAYIKAFFRTEVYSDGDEGVLEPERILWMQLALNDPSLLQDSQGTSVTKHEFAHRLNMPWKITGNL